MSPDGLSRSQALLTPLKMVTASRGGQETAHNVAMTGTINIQGITRIISHTASASAVVTNPLADVPMGHMRQVSAMRLVDERYHSAFMPPLGTDGKVHLPGLDRGLGRKRYQQLSSLYGHILEAQAILQALKPQLVLNDAQEPPEAFDAFLNTAELTPLHLSRQQKNLLYKREDLTAVRAYKLRGAVVAMAQYLKQGINCFWAVSTGNHALGVLHAASLLKPAQVTLVLPTNTASHKLSRIEEAVCHAQAAGVNVVLQQVGETFDEARNWTMDKVQDDRHSMYLDPYNDPWVVAGQGTIGLELFEQLKPYVTQALNSSGQSFSHPSSLDDTGFGSDLRAESQRPQSPLEVVVAAPVGGGGLLGGLATGFKLASVWECDYRNVQLQFAGLHLADLAVLKSSLLGDAIKVLNPAPDNQVLFSSLGVLSIPMTDAEMAVGQSWVAQDIGARVEGASGGTLYPALSPPEGEQRNNSSSPHWGRLRPNHQRLYVSVLSGGNVHDSV